MESSIKSLMKDDYESCLVHYFPALDKTAKKRRPKEGVGNRIRSFLDEELDIISHIATGNIFRIECDGVSFPQAIYKFVRTAIAHDGELDPRLNFDNKAGMEIGTTWNLPPSFITALLIAVIIAPENVNEQFDDDYSINIHGEKYNVSNLWGKRNEFATWVKRLYERPTKRP